MTGMGSALTMMQDPVRAKLTNAKPVKVDAATAGRKFTFSMGSREANHTLSDVVRSNL